MNKKLLAGVLVLSGYATGYTLYNEHKKDQLGKNISSMKKEISDMVEDSKNFKKYTNILKTDFSKVLNKHKKEISELVNKNKNLEADVVDKYKGLEKYVNIFKKDFTNQFVKDGKYDFGTKLLNDKQMREFIQNLEASTERIDHLGKYEMDVPSGGTHSLETGVRGTGLVLYKNPKTGKSIIVTAGHVVEDLPSIVSPWGVNGIMGTYDKKSEEFYITKGDIKISLKVIVYDKDKDFALLETDGSVALTEIPYKIGKSSELEKGNFVTFMGYPFGENVERPSFGWVNDTKGFKEAEGNVIGDSNYSILLSNPTIGGDSGSSLFALRDGVPEWIGFVHAGYLYSQGMNIAVHEKDVKGYLSKHLPASKFR